MYFSDAAIPEFKALEPRERREAKQRAVQHLRQSNPWIVRLPLMLCIIGAGAGWVVLPLLVAVFYPHKSRDIFNGTLLTLYLVFSSVGAALGGGLGGFTGNQFLISKIRRNIGQGS